MKKPLTVNVSPLTNVIYAGTTINGGTMWGANKQDVTMDCLVAVAQHTLKYGEPIVITQSDGTPEFEIIVNKLSN